MKHGLKLWVMLSITALVCNCRSLQARHETADAAKGSLAHDKSIFNLHPTIARSGESSFGFSLEEGIVATPTKVMISYCQIAAEPLDVPVSSSEPIIVAKDLEGCTAQLSEFTITDGDQVTHYRFKEAVQDASGNLLGSFTAVDQEGQLRVGDAFKTLTAPSVCVGGCFGKIFRAVYTIGSIEQSKVTLKPIQLPDNPHQGPKQGPNQSPHQGPSQNPTQQPKSRS